MKIEIKKGTYPTNFDVNNDKSRGIQFRDNQMIVFATTLAEDVNRKFGTNIKISKRNKERCEYCKKHKSPNELKGDTPQEMHIHEYCNEKYEILHSNDYKYPYKTNIGGVYTKEEVIEYAKTLAKYINKNDILTQGYMDMIKSYDLEYYQNPYKKAEEIIEYYKPIANIKKGLIEFLKTIKDKSDSMKEQRKKFMEKYM